jgi:hypothetical protein
LLQDANPQKQVVNGCASYLENIKNNQDCPFVINDQNTKIKILDVNFFNQLGSLGAFSITPKQAVVFRISIPTKTLNLFYWSLNVYVSESFNSKNTCYPYKQINFASLCPPFNNYKASAMTKKSPYDNVNGLIILSLSEEMSTEIESRLNGQNFDFVHVFKIPSNQNSFPFQENLPNPNQLSSESPYFDWKTQRLAVLLRINNYPSADKTLLQNYIYQVDSNDFEIFMIEKEDSPSILYNFTAFPKSILPPINEYEVVQSVFQNVKKNFNRVLANNYLFSYSISTRYNLVSITAPLYRNILRNTSIPYKGGFQALQMAGNMQADNRDTQYRSSQAVCLGSNDVLVGIFVNHSYLKNCFYNSVSLTDLNRAFGYKSLTFTVAQNQEKNKDQTIILVLVGRNANFLNFLEQQILSIQPDCFVQQIYIETGPSEKFLIPENHKVLLVERNYLNTNFEYQKKVLNFFDYFTMNDNEKITLPADFSDFDVFQNITAPSLDYFLSPSFYKISQNKTILMYLVIGFVIFFVFVVFFSIFFFFH